MAKYYRRMKPFLGTFVEIGINEDHPENEIAVSLAFDEIQNIHNKLSFQDPESELSRLNMARGQPVKLSRISVHIIKLAKLMTALSQNHFNCTVGNFFSNPDSVKSGQSSDIEINGQNVNLKNNVKLILDGIAKGYAVDLAIKSLKKSGVKLGWVNAGGDLRVFGQISWPIQIKDITGHHLKTIHLFNAAIATSNVSPSPDERFPSKFISTHGNLPQEGTWSVVSRTAWRADTLTKVAANCPVKEKGMLIKYLGGKLVELK